MISGASDIVKAVAAKISGKDVSWAAWGLEKIAGVFLGPIGIGLGGIVGLIAQSKEKPIKGATAKDMNQISNKRNNKRPNLSKEAQKEKLDKNSEIIKEEGQNLVEQTGLNKIEELDKQYSKNAENIYKYIKAQAKLSIKNSDEIINPINQIFIYDKINKNKS